MVKKRHSRVCPCHEHIKTQTQYFGDTLSQLGGEGTSEKHRKKLISKCDPCFIRYLSKCATGILHSAIKLPKKQYKTLQGDKKFLISLVSPSSSVEAKRQKLLKHSGSGFFPLLARIAATLIKTLSPI